MAAALDMTLACQTSQLNDFEIILMGKSWLSEYVLFLFVYEKKK